MISVSKVNRKNSDDNIIDINTVKHDPEEAYETENKEESSTSVSGLDINKFLKNLNKKHEQIVNKYKEKGREAHCTLMKDILELGSSKNNLIR